jgi:NAD(P)-dependent dehydrogenase (short-subunit alcohol dehydrogenase family)
MPSAIKEPKPPFPPQHQDKPGIESELDPKPRYRAPRYKGSGKLDGKVALITGGDSGIGRAVAVLYAREGANVAIVYLDVEQSDAEETKRAVEKEGREALLLPGDVCDSAFCRDAIEKTVEMFGRLDILVNNAAEQHARESIAEITEAQLERTFRTNILAQFYLVKAALPHLKEGAVILNTTSVTAYAGNPQLIDYAATKGAIVAFTRSLALSLAEKKIRVNAVAPGPIWTPLIPATFPEDKVKSFGQDTPLGRAGQPSEVAPCYVFLASDDASYMTGQVLHPNGGRVVNA